MTTDRNPPIKVHIEQLELLRAETWLATQDAQVVANHLTTLTCQLELLIREMRATHHVETSAQAAQA